MITKTIKTPLMMAEAYGPTYCTSALVPESKLSHKPEAQYGFVPKLIHHGGKTPCFALKNKEWLLVIGYWLSKTLYKEINVPVKNGFSGFSSGDVFCCEATGGNSRAGARACSQVQSHDITTEARRAKTSEEGFLRFLLI